VLCVRSELNTGTGGNKGTRLTEGEWWGGAKKILKTFPVGGPETFEIKKKLRVEEGEGGWCETHAKVETKRRGLRDTQTLRSLYS